MRLWYHRQGNEQKQIAVQQIKIPINQDTKFIKKNLFQFQNIYIFSNGFPHLFGVEDAVKMSLLFFGPDINRMNRPPNNFLPNQKTNGELMANISFRRDSSLSNHSTMSKNNSNAMLFKGRKLFGGHFRSSIKIAHSVPIH